ncbi:ribonuclease HI [Novosphingobium tardum]|uniref:Ribonuclease HI n=1 Tax=Novosphingobium tardum TaxID=1538021 RepID=A0ABV8RTE1_9SPHN
MKIFFDGGCRPTPGTIELAVVVRGRATILRDQGFGSGTDAEWLALIEALRTGLSLGAEPFVLLGDCAPVIEQANRRARARGSSDDHLRRFLELAGERQPAVRYVKRSQNLAGIALQKLHPR